MMEISRLRRSGVLPLAAALGLTTTSLAPLPAQAELKASLSAKLIMFDAATGRQIERPQDTTPVKLRIELTDVTTGRPPRNMNIMAWVRPVERGASSCEEAARAFRATSSTPAGSTDLNGTLLVALNEDGSVGVIDPKLNLASSNMLAAHKFDVRPQAMVIDAANMRALVALPGKTGITQLSLLNGHPSPFATTKAPPDSIYVSANGNVWVSSTQSPIIQMLNPGGTTVATHKMPGQVTKQRQIRSGQSELIAVASSSGHIAVVDGISGQVKTTIETHKPIGDLAFVSDSGILSTVADSKIIGLRYLDNPDREIGIDAGFDATGIRVSQDGRYAVAFSKGQPFISILDLAEAKLVQAAELAGATVSDVVFTNNAIFILSEDGGFVAVLETASIAPAKPMQLRNVQLRGQRKGWKSSPGSQLLVALDNAAQVLAVDPEYQTAWVIHESSAMGEMPPMDSTRLRGGTPFVLAAADRSLKETRSGRFETVAAFRPGAQELVITTATLGGLTSCIRFDVDGPVSARKVRGYTIELKSADGTFNAGETEDVLVSIRDTNGAQLLAKKIAFSVPSLQSGWKGSFVARRQPDNTLRGSIRLPHSGTFAFQPVNEPQGWQLMNSIVLTAEK
jgi:hypothetical protein